MARNVQGSNYDCYQQYRPHHAARAVDATLMGPGGHPSDSGAWMKHVPRSSSTSMLREGSGMGSHQSRPSITSYASHQRHRTTASDTAYKETTAVSSGRRPPSPPRSSPGSPSPTRSRIAPPYERSYTPPLDSGNPGPAMTGTMAAKQSKHASPIKSRGRRPSKVVRRTTSVEPTGQKITKLIKSMFTKRPVNEDSYERIQDRHWAED